jgi:hypothetical protein
VTSDVKEDTLVILEFLDNINGEYYIPERFWTSNNALELFTDDGESAITFVLPVICLALNWV